MKVDTNAAEQGIQPTCLPERSAGRVIAVRDPADPLGMRFASAEAVLGAEFEPLAAEEACRRLRAGLN